MSVAGCLGALLVCVPTAALAQHVEDGASTAKVRLGPLGLTPRVSIRNFGVDTNVLRTADAARRDFTATFEPRLDSWLRIGDVRIAATSAAEWMYFGRVASERSVGRSQSVMGEWRMSRLTPFGGVSYARTERSASLELDARLPQSTSRTQYGVTIVVSPALAFDVEGNHGAFALDRLTPEGGQIAEALNRHATSGSVTARYEVTPLTTLIVRSGVQHDRFDLTPLRNSDSVTVMPGLEFKPFALISGSAYVGYRRFTTLDATVPDYAGLTTAVNLSYTAREMTRFSFGVRRDIEYSYELTQPFYLATGTDMSVLQMLGPGWDVVGRVAANRLSYRGVAGVADADGRRDRTRSWGVGVGRHLSSGVRVGFDIDYLRRVSGVDGRGFHGYRVGGSVTYGS
jgi:hypothetical protein